tara:strand:+ start:17222 stop:17713 length:492 start_codon:yes stop_codon:yes gene_type:complete
MTNKIGIYPGTFDPMTNGHINIVKRSLNLVDKLIIAIADNPSKKTLLNTNERKQIIENDILTYELNCNKIQIEIVKGLLTDFAKSFNVNFIIRGLRAVSDFEYEFQMTGMNYQLNSNIETIFLMSSDNNSFISSNLVKQVHQLGGDVSNFVSKNTIDILNNKN